MMEKYIGPVVTNLLASGIRKMIVLNDTRGLNILHQKLSNRNPKLANKIAIYTILSLLAPQ